MGNVDKVAVLIKDADQQYEGDVPGVGFKDFATQARNAEMIKECDRYLVF